MRLKFTKGLYSVAGSLPFFIASFLTFSKINESLNLISKSSFSNLEKLLFIAWKVILGKYKNSNLPPLEKRSKYFDFACSKVWDLNVKIIKTIPTVIVEKKYIKRNLFKL